ncbi:response regulator transcription factor [Paenibacillus ferrarius]|uniref:response regulator transcription factor n=1 Tax=Paenibacillus ferrarius TaxID=1469647 RepID=UPI003D272602
MFKVLMIEDDALIGDMVKMFLKEEGFIVTRKTNGADGIEAHSLFNPDLILLDWVLPDMDGLSVCREIRRVSQVPIMIVSMKNKVAERVDALVAGADDFMSKPCSMHELIARANALIRRSKLSIGTDADFNAPTLSESAIAAAPVFAMKPAVSVEVPAEEKIRLDENTRSMRVHGKPVDTTYSEFEIMKCLVNHPGRVYSREDLIQTVRGIDSFVTERAIDVHIANLRKKIEDNPKEPKWIRTVWGVGYKFIPM